MSQEYSDSKLSYISSILTPMSKSLVICDIPEYKRSSLCTLHTRGSAGVPAADGADLLPCLPSSLPQGTAPGLGCSAAGSGTQTGTSHKTGLIDRPDRTCTLSRNLSGKAPRTGRISPRWRLWGKKDILGKIFLFLLKEIHCKKKNINNNFTPSYN